MAIARPSTLVRVALLDHEAGFLYAEADVPPDPSDGIPWREVERLDAHWWWASR